jgi:hypothetical protein
VRERIEYRFRVPSAAVFTLYSYSKALEYRLRVSTAGSLKGQGEVVSSLLLSCRGGPMSLLASTHHCRTKVAHSLLNNEVFGRAPSDELEPFLKKP